MEARTRRRRFAALTGRATGPGSTARRAPGNAAPPSAAAQDAAQPAICPAALVRLRAIAKNLARINGDWMPSSVTAVATTQAKALSLATPGAPGLAADDTPVYLVTMTGDFNRPACGEHPGTGARPAGGAPSGRYLSVVVNARSFTVTGTGLSRTPPPASAAGLGRPASLTWYAARAAS